MSRRRGPRVERSAGGVVVRRIGDVPHALLIRDPYHNLGLPKGHLEAEEDPGAAAVREVEEETGLRDLRLGPRLGTIEWYFRLDHRLVHKYCDFFLMRSERGEARPQVEEGISECLWLSLEEAVERISYDNAREMVVEARRVVGEEGAE